MPQGDVGENEGSGTVLWNRLLERPQRALAGLFVLVLLASLVGMGGLAWRDVHRMEQVRLRVGRTAAIERLSLRLHQLPWDDVRASERFSALVEDLAGELAALRTSPAAGNAKTAAMLANLQTLLETRPFTSRSQADVLALVRRLSKAEAQAESRLLDQVAADARRELRLILLVPAALSALFAIGYWNLRHRIVKPIDDLRSLLVQLGSGDFNVVSASGVHPLLAPLFDNYNYLVTRLSELEARHRSRADSLEEEVRAATQTLLEQQRMLARSERLAAVGETAAGLAHELRNPLAGVLMSLGNLRREATDADTSERLDAVIAEIERLSRLLTEYLSSARHPPEPARPVHLRTLVLDLLSLLRYEIPEGIHLQCRVPDDLECTLPRDRIRQALLNLVLNSVQALGKDGGEIDVSAQRDSDRLTIAVTDDGPGFPADLLRGGTQAFASRRDGGTGLGLAMVRRVATDLDGKLHLENRGSRGAVARLVVPFRSGRPAAVASAS